MANVTVTLTSYNDSAGTLYDSETNESLSADDLGVSDEEYEAAVRSSLASSQAEGHVRVSGRRVYAVAS